MTRTVRYDKNLQTLSLFKVFERCPKWRKTTQTIDQWPNCPKWQNSNLPLRRRSAMSIKYWSAHVRTTVRETYNYSTTESTFLLFLFVLPPCTFASSPVHMPPCTLVVCSLSCLRTLVSFCAFHFATWPWTDSCDLDTCLWKLLVCTPADLRSELKLLPWLA